MKDFKTWLSEMVPPHDGIVPPDDPLANVTAVPVNELPKKQKQKPKDRMNPMMQNPVKTPIQ